MEWDERLITQQRAYAIAGGWEVEGRYVLRCKDCGQACGEWGEAPTSPDDIVAAVLRHLVTAHDVALSGAGNG